VTPAGDSALSHASGLAVDPARDELFVVNAGFTIYAMPATGGTLAAIYAAPDTNPNEATGFIGGIVDDEPGDSLFSPSRTTTWTPAPKFRPTPAFSR
jgi:hypothetical protein